MLIFTVSNIWLFNKLGAATAKAVPPQVFTLRLGISKSIWCVDHIALTRVCRCTNWDTVILAHARFKRTGSKIVNCIQKLAWSQWSETITGVIWSQYLFPVSGRAATYWNSCWQQSKDWWASKYRELQSSKQEVINVDDSQIRLEGARPLHSPAITEETCLENLAYLLVILKTADIKVLDRKWHEIIIQFSQM